MSSPSFNATKQVQVTVQIGGVQVPVNSVTLTHQINAIPYVEIMLQLDNADAQTSKTGKIGAVTIDLTLFGKYNSAMQGHILNDFSLETDLQVYVVDGDGNNILFKGYLGQPKFQLRSGQLFLSVAGAHQMAVLMAFNGQIYFNQDFYDAVTFNDFFEDPNNGNQGVIDKPTIDTSNLTRIAANDVSQVGAVSSIVSALNSQSNIGGKTNSIAFRTNVILSGLLTNYPDAGFQETSLNSEPLNKVVQNLNMAALPYVNAFLTNSFASTFVPGLTSDGFEIGEETLHRELFNAITSTSNFLSTVRYLLPNFLFQLNAGWGGTDAKNSFWLEHLATHADPAGRVIQIPVLDISFSMASIFEIPLIQVIVQGGGSTFYGQQGNLSTYVRNQPPPTTPLAAGDTEADVEGNPTLQSLARYPTSDKIDTDVQGMYMTIPAPRWINKDNFAIESTNWNFPPFKTGDKFAVAPANQQALSDNLSDQENARQAALNYFAEFTFKDIYLQKAQASQSVPLNLKVQVGRTYQVNDVTGTNLFTAYLAGVTHRINISEEGAGATTHMDFTHVKAAGLVINALKDEPPDNSTALDAAIRDLVSTSSLPAS